MKPCCFGMTKVCAHKSFLFKANYKEFSYFYSINPCFMVEIDKINTMPLPANVV